MTTMSVSSCGSPPPLATIAVRAVEGPMVVTIVNVIRHLAESRRVLLVKRKLNAEDPSLDDVRRLLLSALGRLSRQGFSVSVPFGMELVHEFLGMEWPGVLKRFDPDRGELGSFVYSAFLRYARPRIVRYHRWQRGLRPVEDVVREHQARSQDTSLSDSPEGSIDLERVRRARRALPSALREVLKLRLELGRSEREVARELGGSRYDVRQKSAEALASLAVALDEPGKVAKGDWRLARLLWAEGRSLEDATGALGWSDHRAAASYRRLLETFAASFSGVTGC